MNIKDILIEAIDRTGKSDTAVVGWGRGMGHKGHMYLASSVITQAKDMNADPYFVVSRTVGKDDPITPEEKLEIYRKVFPSHSNIFQTASDEMPDLTRVLHNLNQQGYRNVVVVVGADQVKALSYVKNYNGVANKAGEVLFNFDSLEVISRQQTSDPSKELEGPRATPMREILMNPNASDEQKFAVWRDAMPDALSDEEVLVLMKKAQQRMSEFKPVAKKAKIKEFIQRIRPMLKEASSEQKLKALKLIKEALTEFDAGEGGFGPFKLYKGDAHKYHHIGTFNTLDDAKDELEVQQGLESGTVDYYKIKDGTGKTVGGFNPDKAYDTMRSAGKMQFKKPGEQGVSEAFMASNAKIDPQSTNQYGIKIVNALNQQFGDYFSYKVNQDGSFTVVQKKGSGPENQYDPRYENDPNVLTPQSVSRVIGPYYNMFRQKGWRFDQPMSGEFTIAIPEQGMAEGWTQKYKKSINCSHPKGFSQKAHCAGKKKHNESLESEMVCEDCGMCETHADHKNLDEACWKGYHKEGNKKMFGKTYPNCVKNESVEEGIPFDQCPGCGGSIVHESQLLEKQDACYHKVKSRYKVWPSAYASGALVQCRKKGAANWGTGGKKNESVEEIEENLNKWFKEKWVRFGPDGKIKGDCARGDDSEGKPKCLPQSKAHALGKKGRASAGARKRREDPNPERSGKAINVNTKKKSNESVVEGVSELKKKISKYEELALAANRAGDDAKCKLYQRKIQSLKQKMSQGLAEGTAEKAMKQHYAWVKSMEGQTSGDIAKKLEIAQITHDKFAQEVMDKIKSGEVAHGGYEHKKMVSKWNRLGRNLNDLKSRYDWLKSKEKKQGVAEGTESLDYQGNCTEDDVIDDIFGDVNNFANMVEKYGDEFTRGKLVVKYDPETDVHSFYYKTQGVAEATGDADFDKMMGKITDPTAAKTNVALGKGMYGQVVNVNDDAAEADFFHYGDTMLTKLEQLAKKVTSNPALNQKYRNAIEEDNYEGIWDMLVKALNTTPEDLIKLENVMQDIKSLTDFGWTYDDGDFATDYYDTWEDYKQSFNDLNEQGVAEGAPELLKAEMPLVRYIEKELAYNGYEKGTEEYKKMFDHALAYYRKFGNVDAIKKGVAEGTYWAGDTEPDGVAYDDPTDIPNEKLVKKAMGPKARAKAQIMKMYGDGDITFRKTSNGGYFIQHEDDFGDTHSHQYDSQTGKVDFSGVTRSSYYGEGVTEGTDDIAQAKERLAYLQKVFDPSYEYSDDHSEWKKHNAIRQEMDKLKKIIGQDVTEDSDNPFELQKKHPMNYGMKKFMIRQIAKHTDYGTSELSLASDEELTQLFNQVVPNAKELTSKFVGFVSEKIAEEKESRLHKKHQQIRKEKGLPDPSQYKKMAQQKQKEIDALNAEIAAGKSKDDYLEEN